MKLDGDEKRIRALFSELALEHQSVAPRFERVWQRAPTAKPESIRVRSLLLVTAALVIAITYSLAWWSRNRSVQSVAKNVAPPMQQHPKIFIAGPTEPRRRPAKRVRRQRKTERSVVQDALILARWQSPTQAFLQSPASEVFNSLPQLNRPVRELESFLPNNDVKESKP